MLQACAFGDLRIGIIVEEKVFLPYECRVSVHVSQIEGEKPPPGLEIAQLQDEKHPRLEGMQLPEGRILLGRQCEVFLALFLCKARTPIKCVNLIVVENPQPHGPILPGVVRLPCGNANFRRPMSARDIRCPYARNGMIHAM